MAWYEDGTMRDSGLYVNGKKEGEWKYYFEDGRLSQYALYSDGQTDSSQYWNKAGELIPKGQEIYWQDASFPGGEMAMFQFVSENVAYPQEAVENGIQGIVYVQFMVGLDGDLSEIKVLKSPDVLLSKEAIRVIERMPPWIPGKEHTQVKSLLFTLPIHFRLG
jgi:protein TonB